MRRVSQKVDLSESFVHLGAESSTSFSNPESLREESCQSLIFRPTFIALLTFRAAHYTLISKHKIVPIFVSFLHESRESEVIMAQVSKKYRLIFWDSRYFRRGGAYFKRAWKVNIHVFILLQRSSSTLMILTGKVSAQVLLLAGQNRAICMCLTCKNWLADSPEPQLQSPFLRSKIHISLQSIKIRKLIMHHPPLQKCRTLTDEMGLKLIARPVAKKLSAAFLHFSQTAPLVLNRFRFAEMEPWVEKV